MSPKGFEYTKPFTSDELKALHKYLMERGAHLAMKEKKEDEGSALLKVARQIEVIHYNAMIFEDICRLCDVDYDAIMLPLDELPKLVNTKDPVTQAILEWRLKHAGK